MLLLLRSTILVASNNIAISNISSESYPLILAGFFMFFEFGELQPLPLVYYDR